MIIFPAIDIRGGKCVRLEEGRFDRETVFAENPLDAARRWVEAGTQWLHIVDLDGARAGKPVNLTAISEIARTFDVKVQLGGGIRTLETAEQVLAAGVNRLILGSVAARSPELVEQLCSRYGEKIVIGIDARDGEVAVDGWEKSGLLRVAELALLMKQVGAKRIIYTDISRDGMLTGVNVEATVRLARGLSVPVIASGGVASLDDVDALCAIEHEGIDAAIVGRAIYEGALDFAAAQARADELGGES